MKITGIIAEYNPFHNGHAYHLRQAKEISGADFCLVVMGGDFMQRGTPAIIDKYARTRMALSGGADLVLELPLYYAAGSAEFFAMGAVSLLDRLGAVDSLCFGSEWGSLSLLSQIAALLTREPEEYRLALQEGLKKGLSFPLARSLALQQSLPGSSGLQAVLSTPNNILGIEYLKALQRRHSSISPCTISRSGSGYHASALSSGDDTFSSASAIRRSIHDPAAIRSHVPPAVYEILQKARQKTFPISSKDFSLLLRYRLLTEAEKGCAGYLDMPPGLAGKIRKHFNQFRDFEQFAGLLKSKELTYSRICRSLLHILLDMTEEDMAAFRREDYVFYARILGFRRSSLKLLQVLKQNTSIPLISKLADASSYLTGTGLTMLKKDIEAAHIYESVVSSKYGLPFANEYSRELVILEEPPMP